MCLFNVNNLKTIIDLENVDVKETLENDRKNFKILVIDDEGFAYKNDLYNLGYKDIHCILKHESMEAYKAFDIIFCDINGVAFDLDSRYQGAALAKNIKNMFPEKIVVIFSAIGQGVDFNEYYESVDDVVHKSISVNQFSNKLDEYISLLKNYNVLTWNNIKKKLENSRIPTKHIAFIEHYYVLSILNKKDYSSKIEKYCKRQLIGKNNSINIKDLIKIIIEGIGVAIKLNAK